MADEREVVTVAIAGNQLQQRLHAVHRAPHRVGAQARAIARDVECIRLVFAELGILSAACLDGDRQRNLCSAGAIP